jgi:hypothetical protein
MHNRLVMLHKFRSQQIIVYYIHRIQPAYLEKRVKKSVSEYLERKNKMKGQI